MSNRLKIRKIGNSAGIVLTKVMLARLGVGIGEEVQIVEAPDGLLLTALDGDLDDAQKWIERGAKRYRNTLRVLSQ